MKSASTRDTRLRAVHSQANEDAIICAIFKVIGTTNKRFIEFGCGAGNQNNTISLLLQGWHGVWFEPHKRRCNTAKEIWKDYPVDIRRRVIVPEKVNLSVKDPLDFLSIDIDGNDYAVWKALTAKPRVVCIEAVEDHDWDALAHSKGYEFVTRSHNNVNAFYIIQE
jgi:predicted O-methyltransferase YrrM